MIREIEELKQKLESTQSKDVSDFLGTLESKYSLLRRKYEDLTNIIEEKSENSWNIKDKIEKLELEFKNVGRKSLQYRSWRKI